MIEDLHSIVKIILHLDIKFYYPSIPYINVHAYIPKLMPKWKIMRQLVDAISKLILFFVMNVPRWQNL